MDSFSFCRNTKYEIKFIYKSRSRFEIRDSRFEIRDSRYNNLNIIPDKI